MDDRHRPPDAWRRLLLAARRLLAKLALRQAGDSALAEADPRSGDLTEVARLLEQSFSPEGMASFVELAFAAVLGRAPSREDRERSLSRLREGSLTRSGLMDELVSTGEFQENLLIDRILLELPENRPFTPDSPSWPDTTERVVEIPWILSRCPRQGRLLEVGYAYALPCYLNALLRREQLVVHGIDAARRGVRQLHGVQGDALRMPYREATFDIVLCVSTLEHLGRDNSRYGVTVGAGSETDALAEIHRVLRPSGRALVSVPFGCFEDHGWFVQYDDASWSSLIEASPLEVAEEDRFRLTGDGWVRATSAEETSGLRYGDGAPGARGLLCATLRRG